MLNIIIIDDNSDVLEMLDYNLRSKGFNTHSFTQPEEAIKFIHPSTSDIIVTDWMMPQIDGLELVKRLRSNETTLAIPIIMLSCIGDENQIGIAFDVGVEDYLVKPFKVNELTAKIHRLTKKKSLINTTRLQIFPDSFEAYIDNKKLDLTYSEFRFLETLSSKPNKVFSRETLIEYLNGSDYMVTSRTIDVLVVSLRKKMGTLRQTIQTVRSVGYKYVPEISSQLE